jgi:ubiquinone/menaquinone biosynthesis C-methylase UbiE
MTTETDKDVLRSSYKVMSQNFEWLKPYVSVVARTSRWAELLSGSVLEIDSGDVESPHFHSLLLGKVAKPIGSVQVKMPLDLLRRFLFIDFGRWLTAEEFVQNFVTTSNPPLTHERETLVRLCEAWYEISYSASVCFFADHLNLRRYFSDMAATWWNQSNTGTTRHKIYIDYLATEMDCSNRIVLDVGCGFGRLDRCFTSARSLISVDVASSMLRSINSRGIGDNRYLIQADIAQLPFKEASADIIAALQIAMHLADPFECLSKVGKILKTNGQLWVDFTCTKRDLGSKPFVQESFFTRVYSAKYAITQCEALGLVITKSKEVVDRHDHYWLILCLRKR